MPLDKDEEELLLVDEADPDESEEDQQEEGSEDQEADDDSAIFIGDEPLTADEPANDSALVRQLRKRIRELNQERAPVQQKADEPIVVGERPALADYDFDEDRHAEAIDQWHEAKRKAAEQQAQRDEAAKAGQKAWADQLDAYGKAKAALPIKGKEEAEEIATSTLSKVQQAIIVQGAENPALVIVALGKNQSRLAAVSAIKDPVKFSFAVAKLEKDLKVAPSRPRPEIDEPARGSASLAFGKDKQLEKLEREAEKTGDSSKLVAYRKSQRK